MHFIRLLDDQTFDFISTYPLDQFECGCSILSCSFSDDSNVYYCVGTAYVMPEENEPTKVSCRLLLCLPPKCISGHVMVDLLFVSF